MIWLWIVAILLPTALFGQAVGAENSGKGRSRVLTIPIDGAPISPVTARFIARAIQHAEETKAQCVVIVLDTPGGLVQGFDGRSKASDLPETMKRAMAKQAESERERRAKVIHAEGEFQAASRLRDAAVTMECHPMAMQMRFLQTLSDVGTENNTMVVLPLPVDLISRFLQKNGSAILGPQKDEPGLTHAAA